MNAAVNPPIIFNEGQQNAYNSILSFIVDPQRYVMVLRGYAGTGKSTLLKRIIEDSDKYLRLAKLINADADIGWGIQLTATTNKACEALQYITSREVRTIQSYLGLRVQTNYETGETTLVLSKNAETRTNTIIVIDEASYVDAPLLEWIFKRTHNCKVLFVGDPAQLTPVKYTYAPVFQAGFETVELTQIMRQADGNPIIELATAFRETVRTGRFPDTFVPDGYHIQHHPRDVFEQLIVQEFNRPDWRNNDSKVLCWTNKGVIKYNHGIRECVQGEPQLQAGDYAVCNKFIKTSKGSIKTDELVKISAMIEGQDGDTAGFQVLINDTYSVFLPESLAARKLAIKNAQATDNHGRLAHIDNHWIDLRAAYSCTINKSQGSTYDKAFIDLDDIRRCNSGDQIARMLYVATSRARHQVIFTGEVA